MSSKCQQLRGAQILDAVRLHKQGFPKFLPLSEFRRRFRLLAPADGRPASPVLDERRAVEDMLLGIDMDMASYRVGLSQVGTSCCFFSAKLGVKSVICYGICFITRTYHFF